MTTSANGDRFQKLPYVICHCSGEGHPVANNNRPPQCWEMAMASKIVYSALNKNFDYLQLDLELKDGKSAGDTSSFITNGEWELIGKDTNIILIYKTQNRQNSNTTANYNGIVW